MRKQKKKKKKLVSLKDNWHIVLNINSTRSELNTLDGRDSKCQCQKSIFSLVSRDLKKERTTSSILMIHI
jgi:hypothetical protein